MSKMAKKKGYADYKVLDDIRDDLNEKILGE